MGQDQGDYGQTNARLSAILKKYWGYEAFRPMQQKVMEAVCAGRDTLALMPTGAGKSLLYQVPAMDKDGVCLVITPLVALMKDQTDRLRSMGIPASYLHSGLTARQVDIILDNASWGDLKFLYVAPERLAGTLFRERIAKTNLSIIAVDEAHCISQWGYDFRPSYLRIASIRDLHPNVPILALTASATKDVARDILCNLQMQEAFVARSSFARPNISFTARETDDKAGQLLRITRNVSGSGLIYTRLRADAEKVATFLNQNGIPASHYHAGLPASERAARQEEWLNGKIRVMATTNAFGMGIDKPDVRFVIHHDTPDSLEAYYQEAGRAGRDGQRSYAVLLTGSDDKAKATKRYVTEFPPLEKVRHCYESLYNYLQIGIGDGKHSTFTFDLNDFASKKGMFPATAHSCLKVLQQNGYLTLTDETDNPPRITFIVGRDELYKVRIDREELDHILRTLLRLYTGLFSGRFVAIDENELAVASGYTKIKVKELMKKLWQLHIIKYIPGVRSPMLLLHEERLPAADLYISPESYAMRKEMAAKRLEAMFSYCAEPGCRSEFIRKYFGEEETEECGACDRCIEKKKTRQSTPDMGTAKEINADMETLLAILRESPSTVKEIVSSFSSNPGKITALIDSLMEEGIIYTLQDGKIAIKR